MSSNTLRCIVIIFLSLCCACASRKPYYDKNHKHWQQQAVPPDSLHLKYSVFLIGDAGNPDAGRQEPTLKLLQHQLSYSDSVSQEAKSANKNLVLFLGDNIYETGMPEPNAPDRKEKERRIVAQMDAVKNFGGQVIFIPGNHDWNESRAGGLEAVLREQEFITNYLNNKPNVFLPLNGCPGPVELAVNDNLVVIILDSEWWLSKQQKPTDCTATTPIDIINQVKDIVRRNKGKNILLAEHHPLFSNGIHGGHFSVKDWIFPLTLVRDNLYIPLPVIGSVYPLLRQYGVSRQDISNKKYQQLKRGLLAALQDEKSIVIAAGHEHALQLNRYGSINHIVSGAGSKSNNVVHGNGALFAYGTKGFSRLNYYDNGECWVEFWQPVGDGADGKLVFRAPLYAIPPQKATAIAQEKSINYADSSKILAPGKEYKAGKAKQRWLGKHYRDVWAAPVNVPYLDLSTYAGGLTPIKMGGGHQTTSLQLQGKDGNVYQFRSIEKDPAQLLPEGLRKTFADDLMQDQISSAHPYGALIIPDMAKAIGIYYAEPKLVYMPYSPLLGPYIQQVGGKLGYIEARPDEDVSDFNSFGNAKNAIGTPKLYEKLQDDNDDEVDQEMFLRCRLFDMLIGDWDRHEDQWRWAEFKKEKGSIYRPIPRDRDQAFAKYDGILPGLMSHVVPDLQSFETEIKDPAKLSIAARNLDRNFLNKLSLEDWQRISRDMQTKLTDEVISNAVHKMPAEAFRLSGEELITKLKSRRNGLDKVAEIYYNILAREVTVAGTDKNELFTITRSDSTTQLTVNKIDKHRNVDREIYNRTFLNRQTAQLNIYPLKGKDSIIIKGYSDTHPVKVRIVDGDGKSKIITSENKNRMMVYTSKSADLALQKTADTRIVKTSNRNIIEYSTNPFSYNATSILPDADLNQDDGLILGLGYNYKKYGFRDKPYVAIHKLKGLISLKNASYVIEGSSLFYSLFGQNTDLVINAHLNGPKNVFNYYGEGNSTANPGDPNLFYRVRSKNFSISPYIQYRFNKAFSMGIGPGFDYINIINTPNRFVNAQTFPDKADVGSAHRYLTGRYYAILDVTDNPQFPGSGVKWLNEVNYFHGLGHSNNHFLQLKSAVSFYFTPNFQFPVTAALRLGGTGNIGNYKFFQANALGGNTNLRGYRNYRFSGRSYLYENAELRFPVTDFRNYLLSGNIGIFGFFDSGRVYSDVPESAKWHSGYGPGLWLNLYKLFILSGSYGISNEGKYINVKAGIWF
ncbi:BamA/TamA family outer membrane protein [Pedobacter sp. BS3]|uniref:BamA/TamA family outer membrane protein n=1 Tax=Pedobacter sp. BS3 TaxID=2567937 RepID=UPI0011EC3311|nr:metallophosphoesterase [Pedobacter sp. BS3]TZF82985.1 BamA/TamA family outer membrane protein [Pedobacter sp. BS3]